jgi:DNA helicase-2/ATP-dependent DNA helicase PcrA
MSVELEAAFGRLSPTQREAAEWGEGSALVLAGPGVGKTTVLTVRIARILDASRNRNFRVLALTFTTKAGDEMRTRVEALVPGLAERTVIGTFHSFCAQILRQHGSHLGIKPDFGVYDQDQDREELLKDALREAAAKGVPVSSDDVRWLKAIDQLRSSLVSPAKAAARFQNPKAGEQAAKVYSIYEEALRQRNIMDFNGMILDACRLAHQVGQHCCARPDKSHFGPSSGSIAGGRRESLDRYPARQVYIGAVCVAPSLLRSVAAAY